MNSLILFLHWLGAVGMGFYLLFPFLAMRITSHTEQEQAGYVSALRFGNRIGQFLVLVQFLTGGYLVGQAYKNGDVSVAWMIASIVLVILIGAFSGMMGGPLKRLQNNLRAGQPAGEDAGKLRTFSLLLFISYILILVLMYRPDLLG